MGVWKGLAELAGEDTTARNERVSHAFTKGRASSTSRRQGSRPWVGAHLANRRTKEVQVPRAEGMVGEKTGRRGTEQGSCQSCRLEGDFEDFGFY